MGLTLIEIARLAGVSRTTASYIVNGKAKEMRISAATVSRVMDVIEQHSYQVDLNAAALRRGSTRTLGLLVPDLANSSYARISKELEEVSRHAGYQLLIGSTQDQPALEYELARNLCARRCDALIVASCLDQNDDFYLSIMKGGIPVVGIDRPLHPDHFSSVVGDDTKAAHQLTLSILDNSMKRVIWLEAEAQLSISRHRREGFKLAIEQLGIPYQILSAPHYASQSGCEATVATIRENGLPDAIITASYTMFEGLLDALITLYKGVHDPRLTTLRLATFGADRVLDFLPQRTESMQQSYVRIAELALEQVFAALNGDYRCGHTVVSRSHVRH